MDASELHTRRLNAKEVLTPMRCPKFIFPIADGTVKLSGGDQDLRTSTLILDSPDKGEEQDSVLEESDGSSTSLRGLVVMVVKLEMISGPFQEISFTVITWNQKPNCTSQEIFRLYQDHGYILGCTVGEPYR